ncbi:MAG: mechanosensitive ion channel family protein [Deltaproteobacteria bacterium]|nr:mechanosensitive ion channel family protein [Deltaproteobacteria bacterium]
MFPHLAAAARPSFERHLPAPLLEEGPRGLLWWQWLAAPAALGLALLAGWFLTALTRRVLRRIAARTENRWDDLLVARIGGPLVVFWSCLALAILKTGLALPAEVAADVNELLRAGTTVALFWAALRSVDIGFHLIGHSPWGMANVTGVAMLPSVRRATKVALWAIGAVAVMAQVGYPVGSLLAGLGIGGLAVALAAQKTVENLIGSVSIGLDVPFKVGDWVRVDGVEGTVEALGLRSTRVRTLDRTVVTFPNGKLSDARIESFGLRDRIRLFTVLQLSYGTTATQLRAVLEGVEHALRAEPRLWPGELRVRFVALGAYSLDVEVMAWFETGDYQRFLAIRQELLLRFLEVVERAGTSFAYPTQTVELRDARKR